jgi:flagellar hook-associated protein 2
MIIGDTATSATVSFSRGFAGQMEELVGQFLQTNGLLDSREDMLERQLVDLDDQEDNLDRRMTAYQERLMSQFIAMESILNGLNSQGGFLENLIDTLPFTASNK